LEYKTYTWKCLNEPFRIDILNKNVENKKVKQVLSGELVPVGGGGYKERI
jgi:hypothetical protein